MKKSISSHNESAVTLLSPEDVSDISPDNISEMSYEFLEVQEVNQVSTLYNFSKRFIDLLGAIFGMIILSPLMIILILCIKLENWKAPVFFSQKRVGLNGDVFIMYKFRSMIPNAEAKLDSLLEKNETTGAMFKMANDPRVTSIGKFIRKTSLDELPQLWNVLKGEMSLVGPRPPLPREVKEYSSYDMQRLSVVPGCTGLWQISGRSNIGFKEMVDIDIRYIQSRNIKMDIIIIIKTFTVLLGSKDAY